MRLFPPLINFNQIIVRFFFMILPIISLYLQTTVPSAVEIVTQIFWNLVAVIACTQSIVFLILLFQQALFSVTYFKYRYQILKWKLDKSLNFRTRSDLKPRLFLKSIKMTHLQIQLKSLTVLSVYVLQFKRQFRYMSGIAYFVGSLILEFFLFLSLSRSSDPVIRLIASNMAIFIGSFTFVQLVNVTEFNSTSKRLLPELNYALPRMKVTQKGETFSKLFLAEKVVMIASDQISLSIADIFPMTRLVFLQLCLSLLQNVLLILNLNESK